MRARFITALLSAVSFCVVDIGGQPRDSAEAHVAAAKAAAGEEHKD
jgi:hypothetical protein